LAKNGIQFTCLLAKHGVKINSITSNKVISRVSYNNDRIFSLDAPTLRNRVFCRICGLQPVYFRKKPGFSAPMRPGNK